MIKVYGDGLDALVTMNLILKSGCEVMHYSKTEFSGGHFRGSENCGANFDLGMVLLEPDFNVNKSRDVIAYDGEFGRDSRVFLPEVFKWLESKVGELGIHPVYVQLTSGELVSDYFISDSLEFLKTLDKECKSQLKDRLVEVMTDSLVGGELHPSLKMNSQLAANTPLVEVLQIVFGHDLYCKFFKPFIEKLTGVSAPLVSARDNRRAWMPNFYPESILQELWNENDYEKFKLKPLQFLRPTQLQIAEFTTMLEVENRSHPNYHRKEFVESTTDYDLTAKDKITFCNVYDFTKQQKENYDFIKNFSRYFDNPENSFSNSLHLTHFCVSDCQPRTVFILSDETQAVRYSLYKTKKNASFSLESVSGEKSGKDLGLEVLSSLGIDPTCEGHSQKMSLKVIRTPFNLQEWNDFLNQVKLHFEALNQNLFLIHPEANNFNDNLLRGLAAFRKREKIACH